MIYLPIVISLIVILIIVFPIIMKASDLEDEDPNNPTEPRKVLLYILAYTVVPTVVCLIVFALFK